MKQTNLKNWQKNLNKFFTDFKSNHKNIKHSLSEEIAIQFDSIINNPTSYVNRIENYQNIIYLQNFFNQDNPAFDQLIKEMQQALNLKKQIIFSEFIITWWSNTDGYSKLPILGNKKNNLSSNIEIYDPLNSKNPDLITTFKALDHLIVHELKHSNLHLLLNDSIMIAYSKNNGYFLLYKFGVNH
ncbi:DUF2714 family protein [[Mycoplasma] cavipharyngis]|uniref:MSC_0623 family F1-like ATPase-associated protein n=1 Tax=[Mycoplasma] cavipharyngis TaxID=92757 RepID=UPI003703963A